MRVLLLGDLGGAVQAETDKWRHHLWNASHHFHTLMWVQPCTVHIAWQTPLELQFTNSRQAWRIPGTEEPGGLLSMGLHRVRHAWSDLACTHALEKEMATHSSVLAWRIPGTEEAGGLPSVGGVAQNQIWLMWLSSSRQEAEKEKWDCTMYFQTAWVSFVNWPKEHGDLYVCTFLLKYLFIYQEVYSDFISF